MKYPNCLTLFILSIVFSLNLFALENPATILAPELSTIECDTQIILNVCEPNIIWGKNYGGSDYDNLNDFEQTADGGYILTGLTRSRDYDISTPLEERNSYWVVKTDQDGTIIWEKNFEVDNPYSSSSIKQTNDGGFLLAYPNGSPDYCSIIVKLDENGITEWSKSFEQADRANRISEFQITTDGGFIFASNILGDYVNYLGETVPLNERAILLIKTDAQGNVEWDAVSKENSSVKAVLQTDDNGYVIANSVYHGNYTNANYYRIKKYDENGSFEWEKTYGGSGRESLSSAQKTDDGGFILVGESASNDEDVLSASSGPATAKTWIVKVDSQGNIIWEQSYPYSYYNSIEYTSHIQSTSDGGYIVGGTIYKNNTIYIGNQNNGHADFMAIKINAQGVLEWKVELGGSQHDSSRKIIESATGEYTIGGTALSNDGDVQANNGDEDYWMVNFGTECTETSNITGQLCNDNDSCTINDVYITDCECLGLFFDSDEDGICNVEDNCIFLENNLIGTPCDDNIDCTTNEVYTDDCECVGTVSDSDDDGVCDWFDHCPGFDNTLISTPCDDNDICTVYDTYDENCVCKGIPINSSDYLNEIRSYGSNPIYNNFVIFDIIEKTDDNGFILTAFTGSITFRILKIDSLANGQWEQTLGNINCIPKDIKQTPDGGYIVVGEKYPSFASDDDLIVTDFGNNDGFIIKLDSMGVVEWAKGYGGSLDDEFTSVLNAPDGGYYVGGQSESDDLGLGEITERDVWLLKLDGTGNIEWQKLFGEGTLLDLQHSSDGNVVFGGTKISPSTNKGSYWLVKFDPLGNTIWDQEYGGTNSDELFTMEATSDGGYILGGWSNSTDGDVSNSIGKLDAWVVKTDALGNVEWERSYGTTDHDKVIDIKETPNGNFIIAGNIDYSENDAPSYDETYFIIKIDALGNILFEKYVETEFDGADIISSIQVSGEDEIVMLRFQQYLNPDRDGWSFSRVALEKFDYDIIGTACDDNDPCTIEDVYVGFCECAGTWIGEDVDGDGVCDGKDQCPEFDDAQIGEPCDDGDPCTLNDIIEEDCLCTGMYTDSDFDGICDTDDPCPLIDENLIGMPCDDGFDSTCEDIYRNNCECSGYPCYYFEDGFDDIDLDAITGPQGANADCLGVIDGPNLMDACGVCDSNPDNDNQTCIDCAGVPNGNAEVDLCGICLPPGHPAFNLCTDCKVFEVSTEIICNETNGIYDGTYDVLFILDQTAENTSFQIINNLTNEVVITDEEFYTIDGFVEGDGYSFLITETLRPECFTIHETEIVSCLTVNIELINFEGKALENGNKLFWTTATEKSSSYFTLERSNNGTDFIVIDKIKSLGNSNTANSYQYLDKDVLKGNYYYRLLETDISGKTDIASDVILLKRTGQSEIVSVAPIPATTFVNIAFIIDNNKAVNYEIYDVTGKLIEAKIYDAIEGVNTLNINLQNYASGMYFIKIIDQENSALVTRFVKED